jgi:hypothetical protein
MPKQKASLFFILSWSPSNCILPFSFYKQQWIVNKWQIFEPMGLPCLFDKKKKP